MEIRNQDIEEVIIGIPAGHKHIRTLIKLKQGDTIILQHATIANILRAYTTLTTHPTMDIIRLRGTFIKHKKHGFADYQLLEDILDDKTQKILKETFYNATG
jgi:hypothetical protein